MKAGARRPGPIQKAASRRRRLGYLPIDWSRVPTLGPWRSTSRGQAMGAEGRAKTRSVPRPCSMARSFPKRRRPARRAPSGRPARSWASRAQSRHHWVSSSPHQSAEEALLPLQFQHSAAHAERSATSSARPRPRRSARLDRGAGSRFKNTPPTNAPPSDHSFSCFNQAPPPQRQGRFWARRRKRRPALDFFSPLLWRRFRSKLQGRSFRS